MVPRSLLPILAAVLLVLAAGVTSAAGDTPFVVAHKIIKLTRPGPGVEPLAVTLDLYNQGSRGRIDDNTLISRLLRMHKFKDQICSSWFAPVGSASDYPLLSKWAIYGELAPNGSENSNIISPVYSLWATFIGLYMANYVVEWSTGYDAFLFRCTEIQVWNNHGMLVC